MNNKLKILFLLDDFLSVKTPGGIRSAALNEKMGPPLADKTIYAAYSFYDVSNPDYHHEQLYAFADVIGKNKLR
jgi:hypothetical protein